MSRTKSSAAQVAPNRGDWQQAVIDLVEQVRAWAEARGWTVTQGSQTAWQEVRGNSESHALEIKTPRGLLMLEPIGEDVLGGRGRVDLYAWPSLYRVLLLRGRDRDWIIRTESGLDWPHPWSQETFHELAEGLVDAV